MFKNVFNYCCPFRNSNDNEKSISTTSMVSYDTHLEMEYEQILPQVYDIWSSIHELSANALKFRKTYDCYKYERSENQQGKYFDELKALDDSIYNSSIIIHQRIQSLEKLVQPMLKEHDESNVYLPAYIRIAQNQLNSLKLSFKSIIIKHNSDAIDYQKDLKQFLEISRTTIDEIPVESQKQETEITYLEKRLESLRVLNDRVRGMNEMTMALYLSAQKQNDLVDNIWLNTTTGSDYIAQSVDEFRLVKNLKQSKIHLWIKLICIAFCFVLILLLILTLIIILSQK